MDPESRLAHRTRRATVLVHLAVLTVALASCLRGFAADADIPEGFHRIADDDAGSKKAQPHLARGQSWTLTAAEKQGLEIEDRRFLSFSYDAESVVYRFTGLQPQARYAVRVFYFNVAHERSQTLSADDTRLHGKLALPKGEPVSRTFMLAPAIYEDSAVTLTFKNAGGPNAIVSAVELWSDQTTLMKTGNFIRFRIDHITHGSVTIKARLKIHKSPWNTPVYTFVAKDRAFHIEKGFTRWYELQEMPNAPGYGGSEVSLLLYLPEGARGATQFSRHPREEAVLREIQWTEPEGTQISLKMDYTQIRTFRGHAREIYESTLKQTKERLFPLTRPPLHFSNAWGYSTGAAAHYMVKTLRLLGLNSVATSDNAILYEKLYGWQSQTAHYWPPIYYPYDEPTARVMYDRHYQAYFNKGKMSHLSPRLAAFQVCDEPGEQDLKYPDQIKKGFPKWLAQQGVTPALFEKADWNEVDYLPERGTSPADHRRYYWSRRFKSYLTPKAFALACESIRKYGPNPEVKAFVALSGHMLYMRDQMPLDMFQLGSYPHMTPGISDWMTFGSWRWDSHQAVAFSVAPFNAGARRYGADFGKPPRSFPMMHCVMPSLLRACTQLANQCKLISYYTYGPSYTATEGYWSDSGWSQFVVQFVNNRAAQVDDILGPGRMRPSRVAMLYSMSNEIWWPKSSFADKRATFLALSHEYYQPELVTEEQVIDGALTHYDALYVLDSFVARAAQDRIGAWVRKGGLLWTCSEALVRDEYSDVYDLLETSAGIVRTFKKVAGSALTIKPTPGKADFAAHAVPANGRPSAIECPGATVRATYADGVPAWLEKRVGKGRIVYLGHRAGLSYSQKATRPSGKETRWADTGRALMTQPLHEAKIERELTVSVPVVMAMPLSTPKGTVIILYPMGNREYEDLVITLREPAAPRLVQAFNAEQELVDIPFRHAGDTLHITLKRLPWEGQMILVRRGAAPPDTRLADMRKRAEAHLAGNDWQTLSAGAWFAGFHPSWQLAGKIVPLLKHEHWAVRQSAAEALGRLEHGPAAAALRAAVEKETDAHALVDELRALAKLGDPALPALRRKFAKHADPLVRAAVAD